MKGNWIGNTELQKYALARPPRAHVIIQTVKETATSIKDSKAEFDGADSLTGLVTLGSGGIRPAGSDASAVAVSQADTADAITSLGGMTAASLAVPIIEWFGDSINRAELRQLVARLDPNADGGGKVVDYWVAQLWRVTSVRPIRNDFTEGEYWEFAPVTFPVTVTAGSVVADVTFEFGNVQIDVGDPPEYPEGSNGSALSFGRPATAVVIEARDTSNAIASNVAWIGDTADDSETDNNHIVTRYVLTSAGVAAEDPTYSRKQTTGVSSNGLPRFELKGRSYTAQTVTFSGAGNRLDLGAVPTNPVEFVVEGEQPGGSDITAQARVLNGSTTWTTVVDGDLASDVGLTGSTAGEYLIRATLTPSTSGNAAPTLRRLGVREIAITNVSDEVRAVSNPTYSLDPDTLKASVPTISVAMRRDLRDYRDYATELFSDNHAGQIEFRVLYGSTSLARKHWLHLDNFRLRNYDSAGDPIVIDGIHPLGLAKQTVPVGTTSGQASLTFAGTTDTAQTVYEDLLEAPTFASRYHGVKLSSTSTVKIGKIISEPRPMKDELDRVAFIEGGAAIPSAGRLKWKRIFSTTGGFAPEAEALTFFDPAEPISISPNLDQRIVSYRAPYNYSDALDGGRGGFANQSFSRSTAAISKLGHAALGSHADLEDETAKWLQGSTYADAITRRVLRSRNQGLFVFRVRPDVPHPWVELGDPVVVSSDRFIGRGLETDRAIRGRASFYGVVVEHDMKGTEFAVWVPEIEPWRQAPSATAITYGVRPIVDPPDFDISVVRIKGATSGTAQLIIRDPGKRLLTGSSAIQFRRRIGGSTLDASWTNWTSTGAGSTGAPGVDATLTRQVTVGTPPGLDGEFRWRANYTDADGTARQYSTQERLANLDEVSKVHVVPAMSFVPKSSTYSYTRGGSAVNPSSADSLVIYGPVVLPRGVTITKFETRGVRRQTGATCSALLRYGTYNSGTPPTSIGVTIATNTHAVNSGAWTTQGTTTTLSHLVPSTGTVRGYFVEWSLGTTAAGGNSAAAWAQITYTAPDYSKTL